MAFSFLSFHCLLRETREQLRTVDCYGYDLYHKENTKKESVSVQFGEYIWRFDSNVNYDYSYVLVLVSLCVLHEIPFGPLMLLLLLPVSLRLIFVYGFAIVSPKKEKNTETKMFPSTHKIQAPA